MYHHEKFHANQSNVTKISVTKKTETETANLVHMAGNKVTHRDHQKQYIASCHEGEG